MQIDKPAKRRTRSHRPRHPPQNSEQRQFSNQRHTFQPKPQDPFEPLPSQAPSPHPSPSNTPFSRFRPNHAQSSFGKPPFPAPFGQASTKLSSFGRSPPRGMTVEPSVRPSIASPFGQPDPFAQRQTPATPFAQPSVFERSITFGPNTFDQSPTPFERAPTRAEHEIIPDTPEPRQRTRRRTRSFSAPSNNRPTPTREREQPNIDLDDTHPAESDRRKPQRQNQLLLKSVPPQLFSRAALQRHFSAIQGVHVTHVSLRGSRRPDSRRTGLITFPTEQHAATALKNGQNFKGTHLQLSLFRQNNASEQPPVETNELFFNYVPESLFSDESIKHLFNSISENAVTNVSLKERPHYGSVKRTAIITFTSSDAAAVALRSLPLYKGRTLTVSFRRIRVQSNNATSAPMERYVDADEFMKPFENSENHLEEDGLERDLPIDLPSEHAEGTPAAHGTVSNNDDMDPANEEMPKEDLRTMLRTKDRRAEIDLLKAAISKKEKQRTQMQKADKDKREKKLLTPKRRESSRTEQEASESGWRKVGTKVDISNAARFVGTCMTMCSDKEFEERIIQRDVSLFETDDQGDPDFAKAVKKYRRSAAISEQPSPDEVRPPYVLLDTMEHLRKICDSTNAKFADVHNFVRDRTRSLRQDFTLQGVRDESCIKIHEESVRFHILSEHRLYGTDPTVFSSKQNLEQLDKCLISLREMYDLRRDNDLDTSPNEPEMQAYYILTQMSDPKTCVQLCTGFAQDVRCSQEVQFALQVVRAASDGFGSFTHYFSLVRSAPYLMACLMHSRFSEVRARALAIINATHGNPNSADNIPISVLTRQLGFEDDEEAEDFCDTLGMRIQSTVLPSMASEVITIRTPSESFDGTKVSEWESARADILIESKAEGVKTSDIVCRSGRNDFKLTSLAKKALESGETKKTGVPMNQPIKFSSLRMLHRAEEPPESTPSTDPPRGSPKFANVLITPETVTPSHTEVPIPSKKGFTHEITFDLKSQESQRKDDNFFKAPQILPMKSTLAKSPKQSRSMQKPFSFSVPHFVLPKLPSLLPIKPIEPQDSDAYVSRGIGLPEKEESVPVSRRESPGAPLPIELQDGALEASRKDSSSSTIPDKKPTSAELEKAARCAALTALLNDLINASETDLEKVRTIIDDAQSGNLRFPKAMEIWDDAKDILLGVSERTERGLQELEAEDFSEIGDNQEREGFKEKLRFCSHERIELWDQLDEIFSKSLAFATANLRASGSRPSSLLRATQTPQTINQLNTFAAYGLDDEDISFEEREVPGRGAEVHSILKAMSNMGLNRWQAIIADMKSLQSEENEMGIAQKWLRQRLSRDLEQESGSLCLLDETENGTPSLSIREVKEASSIPYTANLVILPCDIRTMERNPSSVWTSLEQVLRNNRSVALSYDLPPPNVVVLYYCGSSDTPLWLTDDSTTGQSFTAFQEGLQQKGYVSTCRKLELPKTSAFENAECEPFTVLMDASVRTSAQDLTQMGNMTQKTNLRDHLVHLANSAIREVLDSTSLEGDTGVALRIIQRINESWKDVARHLRREESCWPKEMPERRRLLDAYMSIETKLQLPLPRKDSLITDYVCNLAAAAGVGVSANQQVDDLFTFCGALGHLMNAFVRQRLLDCSVSVLYIPLENPKKTAVRKATPRVRYHINLPKVENQGERITYTPQTEPQRKTKRLREEFSPKDRSKRAWYPLRHRLSATTMDPIPKERLSPEFVSKRRRSLPASYGRRRMFELLDGIYSAEQAFDDLIQETMDALMAKRRRLQGHSAVLVT